MPAYNEAQLNGDALDDLVAYLQTLRARHAESGKADSNDDCQASLW